MWQLCIMTILQNADAVCSGLEQSMLNQADAVHFRDVIFTPIREMLLSSKCTASQCSESGDRMQLAHCDNCMLWHHFSYEGLRKKPAYICYCSVCTLCIAVCWKLMSGGIDLHLDFNKQMKVTKRDTVGQWQCYVHFSRRNVTYSPFWENNDSVFMLQRTCYFVQVTNNVVCSQCRCWSPCSRPHVRSLSARWRKCGTPATEST